MNEIEYLVQYQLVRPDGEVLYSVFLNSRVEIWRPVYTPHIWVGPDLVIGPPWHLERRTMDTDWEIVDDSDQAIARFEAIKVLKT